MKLKERRRDGELSRKKLLKTAVEIFAKLGYNNASNALICKACGLNSASVSYYFGSKSGLYKAAFDYIHKMAFKEFPFAGGLDENSSLEDRLYARIYALAQCFSKYPECSALSLREMYHPTYLLDGVWEDYIVKDRELSNKLIADFLGGLATVNEVETFSLFIIAQCECRHLLKYGTVKSDVVDITDAEFIQHTYSFVLNALRSRRDELKRLHS